jgi:hypothetical protein
MVAWLMFTVRAFIVVSNALIYLIHVVSTGNSISRSNSYGRIKKCFLVLLGPTRRMPVTRRSNRLWQLVAISPEGVKLLSRYHNIDGLGGFAICETDDASALANWAIDWNGLLDVKITAIMDDETIGGVLGPRANEFD